MPPLDLQPLAAGARLFRRLPRRPHRHAGRLARIERMLTEEQKQAVAEKLGCTSINQLVRNLFHAIDGEVIEQQALELTGQQPGTEPGTLAREKAQQQLVTAAAAPLTGAAVKLIVETCTTNLQTIDLDTQDKLVRAEWDADARERSAAFVSEFESFCREHQELALSYTDCLSMHGKNL